MNKNRVTIVAVGFVLFAFFVADAAFSKPAKTDPARLAFSDGRRITVGVSGRDVSAPAEIAVLADGLEVTRKALEAGEGLSMQAAIEPAERPAGNRVIVLRIEVEGVDPPVSRAYWQRPGSRSVPQPPSVLDPG